MARRLPPGARLLLASHNPGKLAEIDALLTPHAVAVVSAAELGLPEPDETAPDFTGNAHIKALAAAAASGLPALSDQFGVLRSGAARGARGVFGPLGWPGPRLRGRDGAGAEGGGR